MDEHDESTSTDTTSASAESVGWNEVTRNDQRRTWWVPWLIALVATVGAGVIFFTTDDADGADLQLARDVASRFGAAYLSFDAGSLEDAESELLALTTDRFGQEFADARLPSVEELFAGSETTTRSEVTDVFMTTVEQGRVRALVFVDVFASTPEGEQELRNLSFLLDLRREGAGWKVDDVGPVPIPEVVGGPDAVSPSSTTVPTDTTPTVQSTTSTTSADAGGAPTSVPESEG